MRGKGTSQGSRACAASAAAIRYAHPKGRNDACTGRSLLRSEARRVRECPAYMFARTTCGQLHAVSAWTRSLPDDSSFVLRSPRCRFARPRPEMCVAAVAFITRVHHSDAIFRAAWCWRKRARPRARALASRPEDRLWVREREREKNDLEKDNKGPSLSDAISVCVGYRDPAWILCYVQRCSWSSGVLLVWSPTGPLLTANGHDRGQSVWDYQHPGASRSHARETGETSLETDPRGALRGRGTAFRTVSHDSKHARLHLSLSLSLAASFDPPSSRSRSTLFPSPLPPSPRVVFVLA